MTGSSEMITERPARSGRVMGLDFGSKTVGVAVSDALLLTAQGVEIIRRCMNFLSVQKAQPERSRIPRRLVSSSG